MLLIAVTYRVKCFEYLLEGKDIVAVLPAGFGKSLLLMCEHISNPRDFSVDEFLFVSPARRHERLRTNSSPRTFKCKMELISLHDFPHDFSSEVL